MDVLTGGFPIEKIKIVVLACRLRLLARWLVGVLIDAWSAHSCNLDGLWIAILTVIATGSIHNAPAWYWPVISNPAMSFVVLRP